ncbi:helix-turn-helix domain-containing protein [Rhizobium rhizogenes]|uniref:helix-turn-helix domain-containing protein n=1 Tax=Rhizobium rhizogenes TaxID=359 RepID=UPI001F40EF85|nr:AraC family transcriptional regulator [Rhizobium rhizogenes]
MRAIAYPHERPFALVPVISMELRLMAKPDGYSFVELDTKNEDGIFSAIPEEIGPRTQTLLGGLMKVARPAGSMSFKTNVEFASVALAPIPEMEAAFSSDKLQKFEVPVGMLVINPAGVDRTLKWPSLKRNAAIAFSPVAYTNLANAELEGGSWELRPPRFGHVDLYTLRMARTMILEISSASINELYIDAFLTILGVYLIRNYSTAKVRATKAQDRRMTLQTSKRVLDYMNEHIADRLSIETLANICRMSPSHFIRAFSMTFGTPPYKYLVSIRLEEAERLLLGSTLPISDIALQTGFSSQSHLTNAMMRYKQTTPAKFRAEHS